MGYCEKCGGVYDDEGICSVCGEEEKRTGNEPFNRNKVKCERCGKEIYEVRRYCHFCGGKNEAAFKEGERYCPKCGVAFEDWFCPSCGKEDFLFRNRTIKEENIRYCPDCGGEISINDDFCLYCGSELFINKPLSEPIPKAQEEFVPEKVNVTYKHCQKCGGDLYFDEELFATVCRCCRTDDDEMLLIEPSNKNMIKCHACGYEMYEVRRYCRACGAKNVIAFKKGEHYCPICGIAFEDGVCPNCGRTLEYFQQRDLGPKEKRYCPRCESEVSKNDSFCIHCRNENYINKPLEVPKSVAEREEAEFLERMKVRHEIRAEQLHEYNERNERRREARRQIREEAERKREAERKQETEQHTTAKIPEHLKTTQSAGYSGYYYADLHTTLWLVLGIVSLVICCLPTGIGTIICSLGARRAENDLEYNLAKRKINFAKIWFFAGAGIVLLLMIASVIIQVTTN